MKCRSLAAATFALLLGATPLAAQAPEPVTEMLAAWEAAFNAGDGAAIAGFYTEDAVRMPPAAELIEGHEAIEAETGQYAGMSIELEAKGGMLADEIGVSWGTYALSGEVDEVPFTQKGRWMNALKKTEDGWKIYRDTWNIVMPESE